MDDYALDDATLIRFWSKVDKTPGHGPNGDCWIWTATTIRNGYGRFLCDGRMQMATAVALRIAGISASEGKRFACHRCDNPNCVKAAHLFWGSSSDNMRDAANKQRLWRMDRTHCLNGHEQVGENTFTNSKGRKECRLCKVEQTKRSHQGEGYKMRRSATRARQYATRAAISPSGKQEVCGG
jgi:hypothetical protein